MKGDESEVRTLNGKSQMSFHVGRDVAAKYTREGEGRAEEDWIINFPVVSAVSTDFRRRPF